MKAERFLSQRDAAILCRLAEQLLYLRDANLYCTQRLVDVISSCILLPEHAARNDCVALHSEVTYRHIGATDTQAVVLVCPQDANHTLARVSILTPLALALLGHAAGSIVQVAGAARVDFVEIMAVACAALGGQRRSWDQANDGGHVAVSEKRVAEVVTGPAEQSICNHESEHET